MAGDSFTAGDIVQIVHRTGVYVAEVVEPHPRGITVKALAVLKHPRQGDLHHPFAVDVPLFHQRKALAHLEKVVVPPGLAKPFVGDVPEYKESLRQALEAEIASLRQQPGEWAERSIAALEELAKEYFPAR